MTSFGGRHEGAPAETVGEPRRDTRPDLRLVLPALASWVGALAALGLPWWSWAAPLSVVGMVSAQRRAMSLAVLLAITAVTAGATTLRIAGHHHSLLADAAAARAYVSLEVSVTSDPRTYDGRFGDFVVIRGHARSLEWRGGTHRVNAPVLILSSASWEAVGLGAVVEVSGRVGVPDSSDLAGAISVARQPKVLEEPGAVLRAASAVRRHLREAMAQASPVSRELVPGLVVGDDQGLPEETADEFRVAGLTHLTAVSGTNLTLVVGFVLMIARWVGARGRTLVVLGLAGVIGFVILARPEPSVVRAAAMGSVALFGWATDGRSRGIRALSAGVLLLLLFDPWLAVSAGFALSACATAGILLLGPPLGDALARWMPRWSAEAIAVPVVAQLACTPLVAVLSGQVSLVAVVANLLVAPAVAPATVLGLLGGLTHFVLPWVGELLGRGAGLCADWIVWVAHRSASLPNAAIPSPSDWWGIALLTGLCVVFAWGGPAFAVSRSRVLGLVAVLVLGLFRPLPSFGWPPSGWVLVACSVGQGDGLVLRAGEHSGVIVDTGPDPGSMDRCLRRLGIAEVPVLVLTHFHDDHTGGLAGVVRGRRVGEVMVTALREPEANARAVERLVGASARVAAYGEIGSVGEVTWQVLGPARTPRGGDGGVEGPAANNASLVLLAEVRGIRILLTGDVEPEAQRAVLRNIHELRADVLKVPHHGSRNQDPDLLTGLGARLALISVGKDNDYGHPSSKTLDLLRGAGMTVARTDLQGDVAVVVDEAGQLRVKTHGRETPR